MLKFLINVIFISLTLTSCKYTGQKKSQDKQQKNTQNTPRVLICSGNNGSGFKNFLKDNHIESVKFINDAQFLDPNKPFTFNEKLLREEVNRSFPNKSDTGMAYIDIEAPYLEYLINEPPTSENFKKSLQLFLDVLTFVKNERPQAQIGYYYIPFTNYWDRSDKFYEKYKSIEKIIIKSDVLFPSIYIFYNNLNFNVENVNYLEDNTREMIKIARSYNKKVFPLIMSRYHPSNSSLGNERIDESDFRTYVNTIMKTRYNGFSIDGLILWNFDDYSYRTNEPKITKEFAKSRMDFNTFYDNYITEMLDIMIKEK